MLQSNQKISLQIPSQLPAFIRDNPDYANFVTFLQAYYEWMEQEGNLTDTTKNLLNYKDIDGVYAANVAANGTNSTVNQFIDYFTNDFLPYFPTDILADKSKVTKIAKQLYQTKGTPASYHFLFRVLYNTEVDFFYTEDAVLKASSGSWYVARSLNLATQDPNFLSIANLRIFGETTKSIATIEASTFDGVKTEVFISDIERLFQSGEYVRVVDANNQDVYFLNGQVVPSTTYGAETLRAQVIGQLNQVNIDPNNRGLSYRPGDPIVFSGGLSSNTGHGASATVGTTTTGSVQRITVENGGYGYTNYPNTVIQFSNLNPGAAAPVAIVGSLNPNGVANVSLIPTDIISIKQYHCIGNFAGSSGANTENINTGIWTQQKYQFANNLSANANTTLANAFSFIGFSTYPIGSVLVENGGGGMSTVPTVSAVSEYTAEDGFTGILSNLGILAPIQITNGGTGYTTNDTIVFYGGSGYGAHANVTQVAANGMIESINYVYSSYESLPHHHPLGGMGYGSSLPSVWVNHPATGTIVASNTSNSVTGTSTTFETQLNVGSLLVTTNNIVLGTVQSIISNTSLTLTSNSAHNIVSNNYMLATASLYVPGILGSGAVMTPIVNRVGSITTININDPGTDYVADPKVSLKVQDIAVSGISVLNLPAAGDIVYQGTSLANSSYIASVASVNQLQAYANSQQTIWNIRVYNYNNLPSYNLPLIVETPGGVGQPTYVPKNITLTLNNTYPSINVQSRYDSTGVITYGDGTAKATASFLNGLAISQGQYLDSSGQLSSYDVLQSTEYNNYTYEITLEKEIAKYRNTLLELLHPAGMQVIGRFAMKGNAAFKHTGTGLLDTAHTLGYYTGETGSYVTMTSSPSSPSSNIVYFNALAGANLQNIVTPGDSLLITTSGGFQIYATANTVFDGSSNTVTLMEQPWLTFANVAYISANANSSIINILGVTGSYDIVNNGNYSNTAYPMKDVVYPGDLITIGSNTFQFLVTGVNAVQGLLYLGSNVASNISNSLITVTRTINTNNVQIFGAVGEVYFPEITDEHGNIITTESGNIILLG